MTDSRRAEDPAAQLQATYANWLARAGEWDRWADRMAKLAGGLNAPLIEAAGVEPGMRVLDLASGSGEPALSLCSQVGAEGEVVATDLVPEMLASCRRRARQAGHSNIRFETTDMQSLPFEDGAFDAATCRLGLMYVPQPERALAEAARVLRKGGAAAFLVWGKQDGTTQFMVIDKVLRETLDIDPHEGAFTPTRFGEDDSPARIMREVGFSTAEIRELHFQPRVDPATRFWRSQLSLRLGDRLAQLTPAQDQALDAAMAAAYQAYMDGDRVQLEVHARIIRGVR